MKTLHIEPTSTAQWHSLVHEAQGSCDRPLTEPLESYLVFLLMRFSRRSDVAARAMALAYLEAAQLGGHDASLRLRDVGDQCLLVSGLFPQRARRRRVRVSWGAAPTAMRPAACVTVPPNSTRNWRRILSP